ncbi:hypothetical protein EVAR_17112_1 [Eumeta japonica]|uniref:Uncharacterized protein n=1 Tax=Eumeta variegata TaxID=151549 RepID=A0A4C1UN45_EUMVA|nr:hypothetical protein EVAR_17112_1 [Eumeta japonica]
MGAQNIQNTFQNAFENKQPLTSNPQPDEGGRGGGGGAAAVRYTNWISGQRKYYLAAFVYFELDTSRCGAAASKYIDPASPGAIRATRRTPVKCIAGQR